MAIEWSKVLWYFGIALLRASVVPMNILVTAGNTFVPIDRVRGITNIFTGRTGGQITLHACERGHETILLTSHPETVASHVDRLTVLSYRTFAELQDLMVRQLLSGRFDALVHCAAVSDYESGGIYAPARGTRFNPAASRWESATAPPALVDRSAGKVRSDEPELWLRLVRTPKLVDRVRRDWRFQGIVVKFKLEVGVDEQTLEQIAERSRQVSGADLMVANTLEGAHDWALLGPSAGRYQRIARSELPARLVQGLERLHKERGHG
jgi:phosphopantothenate---cysteine ligase (CTP)